MYTYKLYHGRSCLLECVIESEMEFFRLNYTLQCNITGNAVAYLFRSGVVVHVVTLGQRPVRIYNSATDCYCDFYYFLENYNTFAYVDRLKYAYWLRDKISFYSYGF